MTTASDWKGRTGQVWAEGVAALDPLLNEVGQKAMAQMGQLNGSHVLDLGCGAGQTTEQLATLGAVATGIDISADLLAVAKSRNGAAQYMLADAGVDDLHGPYDHLYSRCGAMFFDNPVSAYTHLRSEVGPNCQLTIACWAQRKENEWAFLPAKVGRDLIPKQAAPKQGAPGPFAWELPETFEPILSASGWKNLSWDTVSVDAPISMGDNPDPIERAVLFVSKIGPLAVAMSELDDDIRAELKNRLREEFHNRIQDNVVKLGGRAWIIKGQS